MKKFYYLLSVALVTGTVSCSGSAKQESVEDTDSLTEKVDTATKENEVAPTTETPQDEAKVSEEVSKLIEKVYKDFVFGESASNPSKYFGPVALKKLKDAYEYDEPADAYAFWELRSGAQDGPSNVSKVTDITAEGDGWYNVSFLDMGNKGSKSLKIEGDKIVDYK